MSVEFIKKKHNASEIALASKQQEQINYFIQSSIQKDVSVQYFNAWVDRNYTTNDSFHNWLKTILKTDNFLSVFKHLRYPLPSAMLVNDEIKPQLKRVFYAEDSYQKFTIRGKNYDDLPELESNDYNTILFNALLFRYNDIIITDLKDTNKPFRYILEIDDVVAIESHNSKIEKIAFEAELYDDLDNEIHGYLYIDDKAYIFYNQDLTTAIKTVPHDLGVCPADYISNEPFSSECDVVRKSLFSFVKPELEEYVVLKTLQRMANLSGTLPIVTKLKTNENTASGNDKKGSSELEPTGANAMSSQQATLNKTVAPSSENKLQAGTVINIPPVKDKDGAIDMEVVKNFLNFFYLPVEANKFLNDRIEQTKSSILNTVLGDYQEQNQSAKNELQVSKGYISKQDRLREISQSLSKAKQSTDLKWLGLKYGINSVSVDLSFGTDFFLETTSELFEQFKNAPNPIERKKILVRMSQNENKFNPSKMQRESLLNKLLPFASDSDFEKALSNNLVNTETKILQTQFVYYVNYFEAQYGDILEFYNNINGSDAEKLILINNMINELIKENSSSLFATA